MIYIPYLSTEAGRCLTAQNWQEVGVQVAAYQLEELLFKPGYAVLERLPSLKAYIGWSHLILLDIQLPYDQHSMSALLRSPYDGSKVHCSVEMVRECITRLQPDGIIFSSAWDPLLLRPSGDARQDDPFVKGGHEPLSLTLKTSTTDVMVMPLNEKCRDALFHHEHAIVLSDKPANDAFQGHIYTKPKAVTSSILASQYAFDFQPLSPSCHCPACEQGLTAAYLHHLFQQTPLLCQRWLIQHNVWMMAQEDLPQEQLPI